jgi:hypothetical protein
MQHLKCHTKVACIGQLIATYEKDISIDRPICHRLTDGERVQVIIPPACLANTVSMTILTKHDRQNRGAGSKRRILEVEDANDGLRPLKQIYWN